jgi:hypothetical protein
MASTGVFFGCASVTVVDNNNKLNRVKKEALFLMQVIFYS